MEEIVQIVIAAVEAERTPDDIASELRDRFPGITDPEIGLAFKEAARILRAGGKQDLREGAAWRNILKVAKRGGIRKGEPVMATIRRMAAAGDRDALNILASERA